MTSPPRSSTFSTTAYDPSLEWPGDDENAQWSAFLPLYEVNSSEGLIEPLLLSKSVPSLRLIRLPDASHKPVLPRAHRLVILDGYNEVEIGRDLPSSGSDKPRIRLKEMEVSKLHATIYWDNKRREWAVVDMGSKHGTFLRKQNGSSYSQPCDTTDDPRGARLSLPRVSSIPRQLRHLDHLSVGSTTFVAHIHEGCLPCEECTPVGGDEISLHTVRSATATSVSNKRKRDEQGPPVVGESDPKKALSMLRRTLLSRHNHHIGSSSSSGPFVDRSALRRALHPDAPVVQREKPSARTNLEASAVLTPPSAAIRSTSPPASVSIPLTSTNIGHRLLMQQGWIPGTALRSSESDRIENMDLMTPLEPKARSSRVGLGVRELSSTRSPEEQSANWREDGKFRRWSSTNAC
jgi:pSer/pThr/pTyr-binding forkhead associated (FHA) protein